MVSKQELWARIKDFLRFSRQEISGLAAAIIVSALVFSFRDWGTETFDATLGFTHLFTMIAVVLLSFLFRMSCQKIYALSQGYNAVFKVWWAGLLIMLVVAFISLGRLPVVLAGGMLVSFMVKQRLGEFRYGFSYKNNALVALWGILGNMIAAILFAVGLYYFPGNYFFGNGLIFNLVMGFFSLLPLPQLDGLQVFYGSRKMFFFGVLTVLLAGVLLLSKTKIGLILAIIIGAAAGIIYTLIASER